MLELRRSCYCLQIRAIRVHKYFCDAHCPALQVSRTHTYVAMSIKWALEDVGQELVEHSLHASQARALT
jgi:hypothetical protein